MFGKRNRRSFWTAVSFGALPDLLVFGPIFAARILAALFTADEFGFGPPERASIPDYVHAGYNVTHSIIAFAIVFGLVWAWRRKPLYEMLAWPAHIALDLPTHSNEFFPTPILWPLADFEFNGIPWSHPAIWFPNIGLLIALYAWHFIIRPRRERAAKAMQGRFPDSRIDSGASKGDTED